MASITPSGATAETRTKAGRLRRRRARAEIDVLELGGTRRTDRSAIDAGGVRSDEEATVEARAKGPITNFAIQMQGEDYAISPALRLAVFGPQ
jgi:hypothetical protein